MPGCHGLRKLRLADSNRGKGKRGGIRLIYLYLQEVDPHIIVFFMVYGKDERKDINLKEQKNLSRLVDKVKVEVIMSAKGSR
jgi:hypothetical protein